jgi:hypothetical protein
MSQTIRFVKPTDIKATVRGLAIMSVLFDDRRACRYWNDPTIASDLGIWRDDAGNACYFLFAPKGTAILGFDPESPMSPKAHAKTSDDYKPWPGIYDSLPPDLMEILQRKPFSGDFKLEEVTFCIWNGSKGLDWKKGKIDYPKRDPAGDPDGARSLLNRFKEFFDHFDDEMDELYEKTFDADTLYTVFSGDAVSVDDLKRLKPDLDIGSVREALKVIGVAV